MKVRFIIVQNHLNKLSMINRLKSLVKRQKALYKVPGKIETGQDELKINIGSLHSELNSRKHSYEKLSDLEFKVFSQFGDDGIIQFLVRNIEIPCKTFIEFGVEDFSESNTRFLLQKDNWSGFVMDGSKEHISRLKSSSFFWKHDLEAQSVFITKENVTDLLAPYIQKWGGLGILHIDLDGNDYWIWEKLDLKPVILILEYNSTFGSDRSITVPYDASFYRTDAHYSNLYWGSSLKSLHDLSITRGYTFIGCNSSGNNAYFILGDYMNSKLKSVSLSEGFVASKYRESRNEQGDLTYLGGLDRVKEIKGLTVFNTETMTEEKF
jgi:hypothetical protein